MLSSSMYGLSVLRKGDEHPAYASLRIMTTFALFIRMFYPAELPKCELYATFLTGPSKAELV